MWVHGARLGFPDPDEAAVLRPQALLMGELELEDSRAELAQHEFSAFFEAEALGFDDHQERHGRTAARAAARVVDADPVVAGRSDCKAHGLAARRRRVTASVPTQLATLLARRIAEVDGLFPGIGHVEVQIGFGPEVELDLQGPGRRASLWWGGGGWRNARASDQQENEERVKM